MDEIQANVVKITKKEFLQASRQLGLRYYGPLSVLVILVTVALTMFTGDFSLPALIFPLAVLIVIPFIYEFFCRKNYAHFPGESVNMTITLGPDGWRVARGRDSAVYAWSATHRVRETRDTVLLYNTKTTSSLLPKRYLAPGQTEQIKTWFAQGKK